jgi:hypothetical protein
MRSVAPSYDEGIAFDGVIPGVSFEMDLNGPNNLGVVPAKAGTHNPWHSLPQRNSPW